MPTVQAVVCITPHAFAYDGRLREIVTRFAIPQYGYSERVLYRKEILPPTN